MKRLMMVMAVAGALAADPLAPNEASACGGCLAPPEEVTAVESHRMAIAAGPEETILWDQIVYSGDPRDFVWVLPIPTPEVAVELAEPAFFEALDRSTAPRIRPASPPPGPCPGQGGGCGGGAGRGDDIQLNPDGGSGGGVTVFEEETVGPYETVVIGSDDPKALYRWLDEHGYAVPPAAVPALNYYIEEEESVFVVLRLRPGQGVQAMQPVRVRYPGFIGSFPLRMVVVGARGVLGLSLWIIAEQRYAARNYATIEVPEEELTWDWATRRSNYREAFDAAIDRAGGRAWITEYAAPWDATGLGSTLAAAAPDDAALARATSPYPYVTRLRTRMRVEHLDADLQLAPAEDASNLYNQRLARKDLNYPRCGGDTVSCGVSSRSGAAAALLAALAGAWLLLRIRSRRG